jgi:hypothetical protein
VTALAVLLAAAAMTGQSPGCERFCMSVSPREGPEGTVFTFKGRHWLPDRRVTAGFGLYCSQGEACPALARIVRLRTGRHGGFRFKLRAGPEQDGDAENGIYSGTGPSFSQHVGRPDGHRYVIRSPRYRVTLPDG